MDDSIEESQRYHDIVMHIWDALKMTGPVNFAHLLDECWQRYISAVGEGWPALLEKARYESLRKIDRLQRAIPGQSYGSVESMVGRLSLVSDPLYNKSVSDRIWAVIVGVDHYPSQAKLQGAGADAKAVYDYLVKSLHVPETHIATMLDRKAARHAILDSLFDIRDNSLILPNDLILFWFSGYGTSYDDFSDLYNDHETIGAFCPHDRDSCGDITIRELNIILSEICNTKGDNIAVVLDCSHVGGMVKRYDGLPLYESFSTRYCEPLDNRLCHMLNAADQHPRKRSPNSVWRQPWISDMSTHVFLAASRPFQRAHEAYDIETRTYMGVFTKALLSVLRDDSLCDFTFTEILLRVRERTQGQTPIIRGEKRCRRMGWLKRNALFSHTSYVRAKSTEDGHVTAFKMLAATVHSEMSSLALRSRIRDCETVQWLESTTSNLRSLIVKRNLSTASDTRRYWEILTAPLYGATLWKLRLISGINALEGLGQIEIPSLFVIDALDEAGVRQKSKPILSVLMKSLSVLPSNFRFITSRPEDDEVQALFSVDIFIVMKMDNELIHKDIHSNIFHLIQAQFEKRFGEGFEFYSMHISKLATKAEGLFQWLSVAYSLCTTKDNDQTPSEVIYCLLSQESADLDDLYKQALEPFQRTKPDSTSPYSTVMSLVLLAFETMRALSELYNVSRPCNKDHDQFKLRLTKLPHTDDIIKRVLNGMGALLSSVYANDTPVRPIYTSSQNFSLNRKRSGSFYISCDLAMASLCTMHPGRSLFFNISALETSYRLNREIPDLRAHAQTALGQLISYSCRFWARYLELISTDVILTGLLKRWAEAKLLFWLGALSLLDSFSDGPASCALALKWLKDQHQNEGAMLHIIEDTLEFCCVFLLSSAQTTSPLYLSALQLYSPSSTIHKLCQQSFSCILRFASGAMEEWPRQQLLIPILSNTVAILADGTRVVSGSDDQTVWMWNSETEEQIGDAFKGYSPAFSS